MVKREATSTAQSCQKQTYTVSDQSQIISVELTEHSWASVCLDNKEIVRNRRNDPIIKFYLSPGTYTIQTDGQIEGITSKVVVSSVTFPDKIEGVQLTGLRLSSDASDRHPIDDVAEIAADGQSFCTISLEKIGADGTLLSDEQHNDTLFLRSTGGTLMDAKGENRIRSLDLKSGIGAFRVVSEQQPKIVTISVFGKPPGMHKEEVLVEFV